MLRIDERRIILTTTQLLKTEGKKSDKSRSDSKSIEETLYASSLH